MNVNLTPGGGDSPRLSATASGVIAMGKSSGPSAYTSIRPDCSTTIRERQPSVIRDVAA
ncbi:hypothetical protein ACH4Y0_02595 [Streptomyces sp. NPDC020707]|uniref:hypothetical protein n=1 Tax=Streptomyces sp. NPDC020707 TaxID=3365084 RepID=UPI0037873779